MNQISTYALLAAAAYEDARLDTDNQAPTPLGWTLLAQFNRSGSGTKAKWLGDGFTACVFRGPVGQIVIPYAGTEFRTSEAGFTTYFVSGNILLALGAWGSQAYEAAQLYLEVRDSFGSAADITFIEDLINNFSANQSNWKLAA